MWPRMLRPHVLLVVMILAATVPFLDKPFHIDDVLYLAMARQILRDPWDPYGAGTQWRGAEESLFDGNFNPPLFPYLMAAVIWFTGESEVALHVLESVFVGAAALALYLLSCRFTRHPLAATSLVLLSPAMLPGQNVMLEGPLMAFWLWAVWCHLRACETGRAAWTFAAGLAAALGVMTKYTAALVIPVLLLQSVLRRQRQTLWFVCLPALALALWAWHNQLLYGRSHLWSHDFAMAGAQRALERLPGLFVGYGSISLASLLVALALKGHWVELSLVTGASMLQPLFWFWSVGPNPGDTPPGHAAHLAAFAINGGLVWFGLAALLVNQAASGNSGRLPATLSSDDLVLVAWAAVVVLFNCISVPFLAVRHLLPGLPPLVWLTLRSFEGSDVPARLKSTALAGTVGLSALLGYAVAAADYEFARAYRYLAPCAIGTAGNPAARDESTVGAAWHWGVMGWSYYAERAGMRLASHTADAPLRPGDIVVLSEHAGRGSLPRAISEAAVTRRTRRSLGALIPVRTIGPRVHYYAFQGGSTPWLPWRFSGQPLDSVEVLVIGSLQGETGRDP